MKKYIFFLLIIGTGIVACQKNEMAAAQAPVSIAVTDARLISTGSFVFSSDKNKAGAATIYQQQSGGYVLGLEAVYLSIAFDMQVYASHTAGMAGASKLFSTKLIDGNMYYALPANMMAAGFSYIIIGNDRDAAPIAIAKLQ